jgi:hypothetical protein
MTTQIERNAAVVADLAGSDWQMAYVIACSVQIGAGNGRPSGTSRTREVSGKVSAAEFARMVKAAAGGSVYGMGDKAISARLRKWDWFRDEQEWDITASADLTPADANEYPAFPPVPFSREDGVAGDDETNKGKVRDIKSNSRAVAAAMEDPTFAAKVAAAASPAAKRNIATATVDQQTLDDPAVKQKVRGQVAQHDDTASKSRDGASTPTIDALDKGRRALTNSHLMESFGEFRKFKAEVESGEWVINDRDASVLDRFITDIAAVAASVKFEEVK